MWMLLMIGEDRRLWWQIWNLFLVSLEICRAIIDDSLETIERVSRASMTDLCFWLIDSVKCGSYDPMTFHNIDFPVNFHMSQIDFNAASRFERSEWNFICLTWSFFFSLFSHLEIEMLRVSEEISIQKILFQMEVSGFCDCVNSRD